MKGSHESKNCPNFEIGRKIILSRQPHRKELRRPDQKIKQKKWLPMSPLSCRFPATLTPFFQISNSIINHRPHKSNLGEHITLERTSNLPLRMVPCYSTIFSAYHCAVKKRVLLFRSHETCTTTKTPSFRTTVDCHILPPLPPSTPFPLARPHTPYTIPRHSTGHLQCISS